MKDGRPKVSDDILKRMRNVPITMAWSILMNAGYHNNYETAIDWSIMRPDDPLVGRVLTAQYMPLHPDLNEAIMKQGKAEGRSEIPIPGRSTCCRRAMCTWPTASARSSTAR